MDYVNTDDQQADILTKPLAPKRFCSLRSLFGLVPIMIVWLILSALVTTDGLRLNFRSKISPTRNQLVMPVMSPCSKIKATEKDLAKPELSMKYRTNASMIQSTHDICGGVFKDKIETAIKEMSYCIPAHRSKRDLGSVASAAATIFQVMVGITNFIRGAAEESPRASEMETLKYLKDIVSKSTSEILANRQEISDEMERELQIVSPSSRYHVEQVRNELSNIPLLIWIGQHVVNEMYAGVANLKAVKQHCGQRRLATSELAEMVEYRTFEEISPEDTVLESVNVDADLKQVRFTYYVDPAIDISVEQVVGYGALVLVIFCVSALLFQISKLLHSRQVANSNTVA